MSDVNNNLTRVFHYDQDIEKIKRLRISLVSPTSGVLSGTDFSRY